MKSFYISSLVLLFSYSLAKGQQDSNRSEIHNIIEKYSNSVIHRDSLAFYELFNKGRVTWAGSLTNRSQAKDLESSRSASTSGYFESSYQQFMRGLFRYSSTEDKFDHIYIVTDGTVATVTMDYSFWADGSMTNWGSKYLGLIKRDGKWKITSVIYSLDLTKYFKKPSS